MNNLFKAEKDPCTHLFRCNSNDKCSQEGSGRSTTMVSNDIMINYHLNLKKQGDLRNSLV